MKYLFWITFAVGTANSQVQTGSVVVFLLSQDAVTVAADSRVVDLGTGKYNDADCKIRALNDKTFFVMAGSASHKKDLSGPSWDAYDDARNAWDKGARFGIVSSAQQRTTDAAEEWAKTVQSHFTKPSVMAAIRNAFWGGDVLASGLFGSTNHQVAVTKVDVRADLKLFDRTHKVRLWHETSETPKLGVGGALGLNQVADEYIRETTESAKREMENYKRTLSKFPPRVQYAEIARKLVEWSINKHSRRDLLGFPIDELRLSEGSGIEWLILKPGCKKQE